MSLARLKDIQRLPVNLGFLDTSSVQVLDGTSASAATTNIAQDEEKGVLITSEESFHIEIGENPTATTSSQLLPAGIYETGIAANDEIAVIKAASATAGLVYISQYKKTL